MSESKPIQFYLLRSLPRIKNPACLKLEVKPINPNLSVFTSETSPGLPLLKQTVHVLNVEAEVSSPNTVILGRLNQEKLKDFEDIKLVHYGMAPSVHWIAKPTTNAAPFPSNSPMQVTANQGPVKMMPVSSGALAGTQYAHQLLVGRCGTMELIPPSDKLDKYLNNILNTLPDKHMLQNKEVEIKNHDLLPSCRVKSFPLGTNADVWQRSEMAYFTPAAYAETAINQMNLLIPAWKKLIAEGGLEPNSEFFMGFPKIQKKLNSWAMIAAENSNSELDAQLNALILRAVETMITYMDILWELFYGPLLSVLDLDLSVHLVPYKTGEAKTDLSPLDKATIFKVRAIFEEFREFKKLLPVAKKTGNAAYFKKMFVKKPLDCDSYYGIVCV